MIKNANAHWDAMFGNLQSTIVNGISPLHHSSALITTKQINTRAGGDDPMRPSWRHQTTLGILVEA
ncbi:hypothetical protein [Candidatus Viridilinea mediisalina]|uniref:Uncharacterized protein n=1 Tax=Candidatus Viridilinea mediisalina TaxID=2024553 RepID=A0A2A6RIW3_9CHLR|nr:hypothetical protein [Candidatus Viridilinea mediisalina]PDW02829.1 hypothetical protein CJ255_11825 [Candidatus Viridilinea mediisalina]